MTFSKTVLTNLFAQSAHCALLVKKVSSSLVKLHIFKIKILVTHDQKRYYGREHYKGNSHVVREKVPFTKTFCSTVKSSKNKDYKNAI